MRRIMAPIWVSLLVVALLLSGALVAQRLPAIRLGKQPDGSFIVATDQRVEPKSIAFDGRPIDLALHPSEDAVAVLNQRSVFLLNPRGVVEGSRVALDHGASYRGALWSPDGRRLYVSVSDGYIQVITRNGDALAVEKRLVPKPPDAKGNPVPGGMAITRDGGRLLAAAANRKAVAEFELPEGRWVREWPVQQVPFEVRLSDNEKTLVVTNWGGRPAGRGDSTARSAGDDIVVDRRGVAATGTVSLIDRSSGATTHVKVGLHPTGIAIDGSSAVIANSSSDSLSVIDLNRRRVIRTIPVRWGRWRLFGSMPSALALQGDTLYACNGGDNAVCEVDLKRGLVRGFRPAGFFPTGIALTKDGRTAYVVNTKGNGSVRRTSTGTPGNAHDFQGTVSILDLGTDLTEATKRVAVNNHWNRDRSILHPDRKVYRGAIRHVLYIVKENRTYDEVFGDMKEGNGDPSLCGLGEEITPNHHALAREFTLFDNAYVSGTNSADGHQWATQALANDYIERFYAGYSRSYPYDGDDSMALSSGGMIWDAAVKKGKTVRVYGEFADDDLAKITPQPKSWLETWKDRQAGTNRFRVTAGTTINDLRRHLHPEVICWPLLMSDQWRADRFIEEYERYSREDRVPNLMILTLPSDHTEGSDPNFPKPKSMVADNDLALGRVVEAISNSPQWKESCIFVMEDDAQAGPDHIDGHRTVCLAVSPYTKRRHVDSTLYTQITILRSIELMLGLDPMNRFDANAAPFADCFTDTPDTTPYRARPNRVPLDDMNPPLSALKGKELYWAKKSLSLDWSEVDSPDWYWLNRVVWHSLHGVDRPYPY